MPNGPLVTIDTLHHDTKRARNLWHASESLARIRVTGTRRLSPWNFHNKKAEIALELEKTVSTQQNRTIDSPHMRANRNLESKFEAPRGKFKLSLCRSTFKQHSSYLVGLNVPQFTSKDLLALIHNAAAVA